MNTSSSNGGGPLPLSIPIPPPPDKLAMAITALEQIAAEAAAAAAKLHHVLTPAPIPDPPPAGPVLVDVHRGTITAMRPINPRDGGDGDPLPPQPHPHPTPAPTPTPTPAPTPGPDDVTVGANGWGIVFTLSHTAAQSLGNGTAVASGLVGAAAAAFPPAALVAGVVAGFLAANAAWIMLVDHGDGVYLTIPWLLPGVVIPGPR